MNARTLALWITTSIWLFLGATIAKAAPTATAEQTRSCTNAVVLELNGVPRSEITTAAAAVQPDGAGQINWEARDGRYGFCWVDQANRVVQLEVENSQITSPVVFENDSTAIAGAAMIVSTDGGELNVRSSPAGEITGRVAAGSVLILTGQTNGEWVEIEGGSWVSRYHLIHSAQPASTTSDTTSQAPPEVPVSSPAEQPLAGVGAGTAVVRSGSGVNIRRSPDGEVFASVPDGATVTLTGQSSGSWVEIEGGGWVAEAYLQLQ